MVTAVDDAQEKQLAEGLNDSGVVSKIVDLQESNQITNNDSLTSGAVEEAEEKQVVEEVTNQDVASKRIDLQESDHSANNNSFTSGFVLSQGRSSL